MLRMLMQLISALLDLRDVLIFLKILTKNIRMVHKSAKNAYDIAIVIIITLICAINIASIGVVIYYILLFI